MRRHRETIPQPDDKFGFEEHSRGIGIAEGAAGVVHLKLGTGAREICSTRSRPGRPIARHSGQRQLATRRLPMRSKWHTEQKCRNRKLWDLRWFWGAQRIRTA